jgi:hypothetical protein
MWPPQLNRLLETPEPAALGPHPRPGTLEEAQLRQAVQQALNGVAMPPETRELILALILLWHDHLEASHAIGQGIGTPDGSFVHALMHRREPDYSNAKYWWRRVGRHAALATIGARAVEGLASAGRAGLVRTLAPDGVWDPVAVTDACERVAGRAADDGEARLLRELQRIEFEVLLEHFTTA